MLNKVCRIQYPRIRKLKQYTKMSISCPKSACLCIGLGSRIKRITERLWWWATWTWLQHHTVTSLKSNCLVCRDGVAKYYHTVKLVPLRRCPITTKMLLYQMAVTSVAIQSLLQSEVKLQTKANPILIYIVITIVSNYKQCIYYINYNITFV